MVLVTMHPEFKSKVGCLHRIVRSKGPGGSNPPPPPPPSGSGPAWASQDLSEVFNLCHCVLVISIGHHDHASITSLFKSLPTL